SASSTASCSILWNSAKSSLSDTSTSSCASGMLDTLFGLFLRRMLDRHDDVDGLGVAGQLGDMHGRRLALGFEAAVVDPVRRLLPRNLDAFALPDQRRRRRLVRRLQPFDQLLAIAVLEAHRVELAVTGIGLGR